MKRTAFLVENEDTPHVRKGTAMQLEFPQGRYLFLTGYADIEGMAGKLISNLATIPTYAKGAEGLVNIRDDMEARGIILALNDPYSYEYMISDVFDAKELYHISSVLGTDASKFSYDDLEMAVSAGLEKYRSGESGFTDRLVPMWKGKSRYKYSMVQVPAGCAPDKAPESLRGYGRYEIRRGKEGGIVLRDTESITYESLIYSLPGIDRSFAGYAGRIPITYA